MTEFELEFYSCNCGNPCYVSKEELESELEHTEYRLIHKEKLIFLTETLKKTLNSITGFHGSCCLPKTVISARSKEELKEKINNLIDVMIDINK
jgi:hypothetical protein